MLKSLRLTHFGVIDRAIWEPGSGWVVLTGETGAGKTLIVEGLLCITGARVRPRWQPENGETAEIEAVFQVPEHPAFYRILRAVGVEPEDGELVILRRIGPDGRSRCWVQNQRITARRLRSVMEHLVDICDQFGMTRLLSPQNQRSFLDHYAGLAELQKAVSESARRLAQIRRRYFGVQDPGLLRDRLRRIRQDWKELVSAELEPGEFEELDRIFRTQQRAYHWHEILDVLIQDVSEGDDSLQERMGKLIRLIEDLVELDPVFGEHRERLEELRTHLETLAYDALQARDRLEWDPETWQKMEQRLVYLQQLQRKYGMIHEDLIAHRDNLAKEIEQLEQELMEREDLYRRGSEAYGAYLEAAYRLSERRRDAAPGLAYQVTRKLRRLGMPGARFEVRVEPLTMPDVWEPGVKIPEHGVDKVSFWFTSDEKRTPRPLNEVVSGGELARIMLALKAAVGTLEWPRTVVFDEIDMGVGGTVIETVGDLLQEISEHDQVLTVTHWPQLAARAKEHWYVDRDRRGSIRLRRLTNSQRIQELARMMGGSEIETAKEHARQLIRAAL